MDENTPKDEEFQKRLQFAIQEHIPLVEKRLDREKKLGLPEKTWLDTKRFEKLCTKEVWNPTVIKVLQRELEGAQFIIKNFEVPVCGYKDPSNGIASHDQSAAESHGEEPISAVPTLTFGDVSIPLKFAGKCHPMETESLNRKYVLLSEQSSPKKVYQLLTEVWGLPKPNVVISFTNGSIEHNKSKIKDFICELHKFCNSTGAWIFTNGLRTGVSQFIGRTIQKDFHSDMDVSNKEKTPEAPGIQNERETTHISFCNWAKLGDKTLLHGVSLQNKYSSKYFYHMEQGLGVDEVEDMLSPFQHASLLVQSKDPQKEHHEQELRSNLITFLKQETSKVYNSQKVAEDEYDVTDLDGEAMVMLTADQSTDETEMMSMLLANATVVPVVTCVIGGDESTLDEIRTSVKSAVPVIIISDTGMLSQCLENIYNELENLLPRACIQKPDLTQEEKNCIDDLLSKDPSFFSIMGEGSRARYYMEEIMRYRYFISVLKLSSDSTADLLHLVQALYKPYTPSECMQIALSIDNINLLNPIFVREIDHGIKNCYTDTRSLIALHRVNFEKNAKLFGLIKYRGDKTSNGHILPLVGSLLFEFAGFHYKVMYQHGISDLDGKLSSGPREQFWHLFIYSVLANKPAFAEYFLSLTQCPLGAALFAYKLFKSQASCARQKVDNEKADLFESSAQHFQNLAVRLLDIMYQRKPEKAYVSLTREVPCDPSTYVTPLSMAVDGEAMQFIQTACVQTYLQRVWVKNMELSLSIRWILPLVSILPVILPFIHFQETETPAQYVAKDDDNKDTPRSQSASCLSKEGSWLWKVKSFYTAPIIKFNLSALSYVAFLVLISYFFLSQLGPFHSVSDMTVVEWLCYVWVLGMVCEELAQIGSKQSKGLLKGKETTADVWLWHQRWALTPYIQKPIMYLKDGSWNIIDLFMLSLFFAATLFRFKLPLETFQIVRVLYGVCIIVFFARFLRYFYILKVIGPRIIALRLMFLELIYFLAILGVFLFSFGVAFQGLLHPEQPPSWQVLADIIWRPYWQMFGELFIGDGEESRGMGRDVGNMSCTVASEHWHGNKTLNCYSYIPSIFLGVYLFISNILLLNLLIAIFGNTLNSVEAISNTHWAFHQYSIVHEYYYKCWLPPPFNMLWYTFAMLWFCIRMIYKSVLFLSKSCKVSSIKNTDCYTSDHFRMHSIMDDKYMKQVDPDQKMALRIIKRIDEKK